MLFRIRIECVDLNQAGHRQWVIQGELIHLNLAYRVVGNVHGIRSPEPPMRDAEFVRPDFTGHLDKQFIL